jgi:hypothetical protein
MLGRGAKDKEHAMSQKLESAIAVIGIDIGKNSFHVVGHDERGAIVLRQKWSRGLLGCRPGPRDWKERGGRPKKTRIRSAPTARHADQFRWTSFDSHHADLFTSRSDRSPRTITSRRRPTVVVASCPAPINS